MAVISQSGAFMISRMSKMPRIEPRYAVSLGNQIDLTASDYLELPQGRTRGPDLRRLHGGVPSRGRLHVRPGRQGDRGRRPDGHRLQVGAFARRPRGGLEPYGLGGRRLSDLPVHPGTGRGDRLRGHRGVREHGPGRSNRLADKKTRGNRVGLVSNAGFECVIMADSLKGRRRRARACRVLPGDGGADRRGPSAPRASTGSRTSTTRST